MAQGVRKYMDTILCLLNYVPNREVLNYSCIPAIVFARYFEKDFTLKHH